jgi:hypothetical protein
MKKSFTLACFIAIAGATFAQSSAVKNVNNVQTAPYRTNHIPTFNYMNVADGDTVFHFDGNVFFGEEGYVDFNVFDYANEDLDGLAPAPQIVDGFSSNRAFTFFFNPDAQPDTTYWIGAYSWFEPAGQADNWFTMGPIKCPEQGGKLQWQHRMPDNQFRDGYSIYVGTTGLQPYTDFPEEDRIFRVNDNAPATNGDTIWKTREAFIPVDKAGQDIYIAVHHNANDMFILYLDEFAVVADAAASVADVSTIKMNVFPTLANNNLTVNFGENNRGMANFSIVDLQGRLVRNIHGGNNVSNAQFNINVSDLNDGFYMLITDLNGKRRTDKFIIKH